jgi:hypothetical protein
MSLPIILFIAFAVVLLVLLVWTVRPAKQVPLSVDHVLDTLCQKRHYARLPQILQCLRQDDTDFLYARGHHELGDRLRRERKRIALRYLTQLEDEYQLLLETSRILAKIAPEISMTDEFQLFRLKVRFVVCCRYLRWRLRLGLQPWDLFGILSDMEGDITLRLEAATAHMGERAALASEFPSFLQDRGGGRE